MKGGLTTRTQPLLSCMTIARMNRGSTPLELEMLRIEALRSAISPSESSATPQLAHDDFMMGSLFVNLA